MPVIGNPVAQTIHFVKMFLPEMVHAVENHEALEMFETFGILGGTLEIVGSLDLVDL